MLFKCIALNAPVFYYIMGFGGPRERENGASELRMSLLYQNAPVFYYIMGFGGPRERENGASELRMSLLYQNARLNQYNSKMSKIVAAPTIFLILNVYFDTLLAPLF